jgi:hypothetical protein
MGRSTKHGQKTGRNPTKHTYLKRRCCIDKCRKKAMDIIEGKHLCRIHSPKREGYNGI